MGEPCQLEFSVLILIFLFVAVQEKAGENLQKFVSFPMCNAEGRRCKKLTL
jgi:hypothetical protein